MPGGVPYAGGLAIRLPFGAIYTTNITADKDTGIGKYNDVDFLNAVQRGIRPDGTRLYPAMPFPSYTFNQPLMSGVSCRYIAVRVPEPALRQLLAATLIVVAGRLLYDHVELNSSTFTAFTRQTPH